MMQCSSGGGRWRITHEMKAEPAAFAQSRNIIYFLADASTAVAAALATTSSYGPWQLIDIFCPHHVWAENVWTENLL
jgi:hypothetical protein